MYRKLKELQTCGVWEYSRISSERIYGMTNPHVTWGQHRFITQNGKVREMNCGVILRPSSKKVIVLVKITRALRAPNPEWDGWHVETPPRYIAPAFLLNEIREIVHVRHETGEEGCGKIWPPH
jgi:hypothetical protein